MAVGARQGTQQYDSLLKAPARLLFKFLVEFTTGSQIPDINSGLRSFRKSQALPYFPDLCQGFSLTTTPHADLQAHRQVHRLCADRVPQTNRPVEGACCARFAANVAVHHRESSSRTTRSSFSCYSR